MQATVAVLYLLAAAFDSNQAVTRADASTISAVFNTRGDMTSYSSANRLSATFEDHRSRGRLGGDCLEGSPQGLDERERTSQRDAVSIWQAGYGFDNSYRLVSYTPSPITKTLAPPPATMTYDTDNRLANYNGQSVGSDGDGNLLSVPLNGTLLGPVTWDARNRLTGAGDTTYVHDAENRRVSSTLSGQTTTYLWNRGARLDQLLVKTNPDGSVTRYVHGLGLLYEETTPAGGGSATTSFYHYNWQGSTVALSDASGNVIARLSYSPYGERTVESGTVTTPFCFNGQFGVMTESNGLLCMQARFYSPIFRRFLSEDPAGFSGGINLYAYTGGDPVNLMDPFGLGPMGVLDSLFDGLASVFGSVMQAGESLFMAAGGWEYDYQQRLRNEASAEYWGQFSDGERIIYGLVPGAYQTYEAMLSFSMGDYSGGTEHLVYAGIELGMAWFTGKAMAPAAAGGTTTLYRVVGPNELSVIQQSGRYMPSTGGLEVKYFFPTAEQGSNFAANPGNAQFGPFTLTSTRIPTSLLEPSSIINVAGEGTVITIPNAQLPILTAPKVH